jgi:hypothetical protein
MIDLTSSTDAEYEAKRIAQEFIAAQIDISVGPLFEGKLLKLTNREHILFLGLDHIVCDGTSNAILARELWTLYNQTVRQQPSFLPELPVQFADYAIWQERIGNTWLKRHGAYWKTRLTDAPYLRPPRDAGLNDEQRPFVVRVQIPLGQGLTSNLRAAARRERMPLPSVILTIVATAMSRWCDQDDFVLAFVSHGRDRPELAHMIGYLANYLYIRIAMNKEDSLLQLLKNIHVELQSAYEHRDYGRVPALYLKSSPGLVFNWVPTLWSPADWSQWSVQSSTPVNGELQTKPYPMQLPLMEMDPSFQFHIAPSDTKSGIVFTVAYRSDLFTPKTIQWLFDSVRLLSEDFCKRPTAPLASLSLAS